MAHQWKKLSDISQANLSPMLRSIFVASFFVAAALCEPTQNESEQLALIDQAFANPEDLNLMLRVLEEIDLDPVVHADALEIAAKTQRYLPGETVPERLVAACRAFVEKVQPDCPETMAGYERAAFVIRQTYAYREADDILLKLRHSVLAFPEALYAEPDSLFYHKGINVADYQLGIPYLRQLARENPGDKALQLEITRITQEQTKQLEESVKLTTGHLEEMIASLRTRHAKASLNEFHLPIGILLAQRRFGEAQELYLFSLTSADAQRRIWENVLYYETLPDAFIEAWVDAGKDVDVSVNALKSDPRSDQTNDNRFDKALVRYKRSLNPPPLPKLPVPTWRPPERSRGMRLEPFRGWTGTDRADMLKFRAQNRFGPDPPQARPSAGECCRRLLAVYTAPVCYEGTFSGPKDGSTFFILRNATLGYSLDRLAECFPGKLYWDVLHNVVCVRANDGASPQPKNAMDLNISLSLKDASVIEAFFALVRAINAHPDCPAKISLRVPNIEDNPIPPLPEYKDKHTISLDLSNVTARDAACAIVDAAPIEVAYVFGSWVPEDRQTLELIVRGQSSSDPNVYKEWMLLMHPEMAKRK